MTTITLENAGLCADCGLPAIGATRVERDGAERLVCGQCVRLPRVNRERVQAVPMAAFPWVRFLVVAAVAGAIVVMTQIWGPAK